MSAAPRRYAADTSVSPERSQAELSVLLRKHGANQVSVGTDTERGLVRVVFVMSGRHIRLEMRIESPEQVRARVTASSKTTPQGWFGWTHERRLQWCRAQSEQAERSRWRALILVTKAKLEFVADGLSTLEREFLADMLLPNGTTVGEHVKEGIEEAYLNGSMPRLLLAAGGAP